MSKHQLRAQRFRQKEDSFPVAEAIVAPSSSSEIDAIDFVTVSPNDVEVIGHFNEAAAKDYLTSKAWPPGLQNFLIKNVKERLPHRIFICDDSGSMSKCDGKKYVGGEKAYIKSSRWSEMTDTLRFHAGLAHEFKCSSEFRFLNSSSPILIGNESDEDNYNMLLRHLDGSPGGETPLCQHIIEVIKLVRRMETLLIRTGQKVAIVIMTDGEASDGNLCEAMKPLRSLPVWVVIRLCSDEKSVVNYWNNIDAELELEMDIIDDFVGESNEVVFFNPWITYGEPLHRLREFGVHLRELDLIDETSLSHEHMRSICALILNASQSSLSHPESNLQLFIREVDQLAKLTPKVYNAQSKSMDYWIDAQSINKYYGTKQCCYVM